VLHGEYSHYFTFVGQYLYHLVLTHLISGCVSKTSIGLDNTLYFIRDKEDPI